ncbi:DNA repair exonuclease SbcCD nuclease subunit [Cytobacillus eiseniae]|uniref:DNA repair exonuclease SbcCD nuclease subunit n=1 Tax=Cytobacillus eiseniae TaxID=762947 RepID=A0ABS4REC5_9BACI|nr:DNA repair exonuclease [Cytobacillus eiseniae]MBP2241069.1 DNA repair exonuclease SbcCD nuclease subunit [Cytobacillus eiseniae]
MKKLTFIHAADLHLDSPMIGLKHLPQSIFRKLQESTFEALRTIVDQAIVLQVDFVILAGDLFDGEDRSVRAQIRFLKEMERLRAHNIAVFAVHGNHDHLDGEWTYLPMPENVYIFPQEMDVKRFVTNKDISINLYGFSYPKRHVYERMIQYYTKKEDADFHIGILHGQIEGNREHGNYAPFTVNELLEKNFDYWALGHIHKRHQLHAEPPVIYPGNIQGRNRKETGKKGCYYVQLTDMDAQLQFIESSSVLWEEVMINASAIKTFHELYLLCRKEMERYRADNQGTILTITAENIDMPQEEYKSLVNGELLDILQEEEKGEDAFVWVASLNIKEKEEWTLEQLMNESDFYYELIQTARHYEQLDQRISALFDHPLARRYVDSFTDEEKRKLANEAQTVLLHLIYKQ